VIEFEHERVCHSTVDARMSAQIFIDVSPISNTIPASTLDLPPDQMRHSVIVLAPISLLTSLATSVTPTRRNLFEKEIVERLLQTTPCTAFHVNSISKACASVLAF